MRIKGLFLSAFLILSVCAYAQEYSTWGEIYDYEVGDEFHREYSLEGSLWCKVYSNSLVIAKEFSADSNTVTYSFFYKELSKVPEYPWVYSEEYIDMTYYNLNSQLVADCTYYSAIYNSRKINYRDTIQYGNQPYFGEYEYFVEGCGLAKYLYWEHMKDQFSVTVNDSLLYFKKGNEEWGTPHIVVGTEELDEYLNTITLFPNPAGDRMQLSVDNNVVVEEMRMFDQMGKMILTVSSNYKNIDVSDLNPGMYIVEIITNQGRVCRKLVVE